MNKTYYVCKYTPIELLEAFGGECQNLNEMPQGFDHADQIAHPNICGFGKALLEAVMSGKVKELVLVNCCDTIRSVYDILEDSGKLDFLYMIDVLHCDAECSRERTAVQLKGLAKAYGEYKGTRFDEEFISSSQNPVSYLLHALGFKKEQKTIAFEQAYIQNGDYIIGVGVRSFNAVQDIENDVLKKDLYKILNSIKFSGNL